MTVKTYEYAATYAEQGSQEHWAIWRTFAPPEAASWYPTILKATGPTEAEAWLNFREKRGLDETGVCRGPTTPTPRPDRR